MRSALVSTLLCAACLPTSNVAPLAQAAVEQQQALGSGVTLSAPDGGGGRFGHALVILHDAQGQPHLVVGAPDFADAGAVYIYGRAANTASLPPLQKVLAAPLTTNGFGSALTTVDLDNDGIEDLIVGAPYSSEGIFYDGGHAFFFRGTSDGGLVQPYQQLIAPLTLSGAFFGAAVAALPSDAGTGNHVAVLAPGLDSVDVFGPGVTGGVSVPVPAFMSDSAALCALDYNKDRRPDLLVGAPLLGTVFAMTASANGFSTVASMPLGNAAGASMASLGDLDGDGRADALIGAPDFNNGTGGAYYVSGSTLDVAGTVDSAGAFSMQHPNAHFGDMVANIGAFEGPEVKFVVGAPREGSSGMAYLYSAQTLGAVGRPIPLGSAVGAMVNARFGVSAVGGADMSGDSKTDIAIGAEGQNAVILYYARTAVPPCTPCLACEVCISGQCYPVPDGVSCATTLCQPFDTCSANQCRANASKCPGLICDEARDAGCYAAGALHITADANPNAIVGVPYHYSSDDRVHFDGGTPPYAFGACTGKPFTDNFSVDSGIVSWTPSVTGATPFCITMTDSNPAARATDSYSFTVNVASPSTFTVAPNNGVGQVPFTVSGDVTSTGGATSWQWDFGDMSPLAFGAHTTHTYLMPGTYRVELRSFSGSTASVTSDAIVQVLDRAGNVPPKGRILGPDSSSKLSCSPCDPSVTDIQWDFEDGPVLMDTVMAPTWPAGSTHRVRLTVTDAKGLHGYDYKMLRTAGSTGSTSPECHLGMDPPAGNAPLSGVSWVFVPSDAGVQMTSYPSQPYADAGRYVGHASFSDSSGSCEDFAWVTALDELAGRPVISGTPAPSVSCGASYAYSPVVLGDPPFTYSLSGPPGAVLMNGTVSWQAPKLSGDYAFTLTVMNDLASDSQKFSVHVDCGSSDSGAGGGAGGGDGTGGSSSSGGGAAEENLQTCGCGAGGEWQLLAWAAALALRRLSRR